VSTARTLRDERGRDLWKTEKGPNGRCLCRWCRTEVPKGRYTYCSDDCVHEWRVRNDSRYMRAQVFKRDKGVCAECGRETFKLAAELAMERTATWLGRFSSSVKSVEAYKAWRARIDKLVAEGFSEHRLLQASEGGGSLWDADHVNPVIEGGGTCGLENIRTLCIPCHKAETKKLAKRRAEARRQSKGQP
jgi:5-methylcytosine-specific restriction protein A